MSIVIDLSGQVALVTGAGSGIGEATAKTLARAGASVGITDLSAEAAQRVAREISDGGGRAVAAQMDIGDRASAEAAVATLRAELGPVDHLVNNAAAWALKKFVDHTPEDIERVVGITLTGTMMVTQIVLDDIIAKSGSIVIICSDSGRTGERNMSVYAAAKAGLIGFTKSLALEVGRKGVNVNAVSPGTTKSAGGMTFINDAGGEEKLAKAYPLGRLGEPQDIANAVLFMVSPLSAWITGQTLSVSGGFTML